MKKLTPTLRFQNPQMEAAPTIILTHKSFSRGARHVLDVHTKQVELIRKHEELRDTIAALKRTLHLLSPPPFASTAALSTLNDYLPKWIEARQGLKDSTRKRYRELMTSVLSSVGEMRIDEVLPSHIETIYAEIIRKGRSPKTALNAHRILKMVFTDASNKRLISWNPILAVTPPRAQKFEPVVLTRDNLKSIFDASSDCTNGPLIRFLAYTGLRLGEALGLRWSAIDLNGGRLMVKQTLNTTGRLTAPKTTRSRRTIDLSSGTVRLLLDIREAQDLALERGYTIAVSDHDTNWVFTNRIGGPRSQSSVNYSWQRAIVKANLGGARLHDLRHAHATHLLAAGWDVSAVAERLGHSQTSTTLNIYGHALPSRRAALAQSIDRIFGN